MIINQLRIQELKSLDADGSNQSLREMINFYLNTTPDRLKKMIEFFYLKDLKHLQMEAADLKSASETIGADDMSLIAQEIRDSKDDPDTEEYLRERIKKLRPGFESIKTELSVYL